MVTVFYELNNTVTAYYSAQYNCPGPGNGFFSTTHGFFPTSRGKNLFFLPYDSYLKPSPLSTAEQKGDHNISASPNSAGSDALPRHRPPPIARSRRPSYCRFITIPSTIPPLGSASLHPPQPPQRPILPHHRQRHAIIPITIIQGHEHICACDPKS